MRSRSRFIGRRREGSRESSTQAGHGRAAGRLTGASAEAFTGGRLDMETAPGGAVSADTPEGLRSAAAGPGPGAGSAAAAAASAATPAAGTGARPRARGAGPCGWMSCPECHLEPPVSSTRLGCPGQLGPRGVRRRRGGGKSFSMAGAGLGKDVWKRADQGNGPAGSGAVSLVPFRLGVAPPAAATATLLAAPTAVGVACRVRASCGEGGLERHLMSSYGG